MGRTPKAGRGPEGQGQGGSYPAGAPSNHTGGHSAVAEGGGCAGPYVEGLPSCCRGSRPLVRVWLQGLEGWCQWRLGGMGAASGAYGMGGTRTDVVVGSGGGRVLRCEEESLIEDDHIQVRFRGVGGGGEGEEGQAGVQGGPLGGDSGALALEKMMEMMRLQGEQLQLLAAGTNGLQKEVEELKSGKGKEKQQEEKEEPIPPISVANLAKMEAAPHLPRWMSGQCKLLRECLEG